MSPEQPGHRKAQKAADVCVMPAIPPAASGAQHLQSVRALGPLWQDVGKTASHRLSGQMLPGAKPIPTHHKHWKGWGADSWSDCLAQNPSSATSWLYNSGQVPLPVPPSSHLK